MPLTSRIRVSAVMMVIIPSVFAVPFEVQKRAANLAEQQEAPWHLMRISSKVPISDSTTRGVYRYPAEAGEGVDIYFMDRPIHIDFPEFENRGKKFPGDDRPPVPASENYDHGTASASVAAGKVNGVAKKATVWGTSMLDCEGVITNHIKRREAGEKNGTWKGSVVNISVGKYLERQDEYAENLKCVKNMLDIGIHVVAAVGNNGNSGQKACDHIPSAVSRESALISVGMTDYKDKIHPETSLGGCIDMWAPGVNINTAGFAYPVYGTSFASPMVAGLLAVELSRDVNKYYRTRPAEMKTYIKSIAFQKAVTDSDGKPASLVGYNYGGVIDGAPTPNPPPQAPNVPIKKPIKRSLRVSFVRIKGQGDELKVNLRPEAGGGMILSRSDFVDNYVGQEVGFAESPRESNAIPAVICGPNMPEFSKQQLKQFCDKQRPKLDASPGGTKQETINKETLNQGALNKQTTNNEVPKPMPNQGSMPPAKSSETPSNSDSTVYNLQFGPAAAFIYIDEGSKWSEHTVDEAVAKLRNQKVILAGLRIKGQENVPFTLCGADMPKIRKFQESCAK
ncbi:Cerevisin [Arthrobotrys entomopaga]|nr:Cerevisin [Arthrobotrys entomopaga]